MLLLFSRPVSITRVHLIRYGEENGQRDMPQIDAGPAAVVDFPSTVTDTTVDNGYAALSVTGSWTSQVDFSQSNLLAPGYALLGVDFSLDPPPVVSEPTTGGAVPLPPTAWLLAGVMGVLVTRRLGNKDAGRH